MASDASSQRVFLGGSALVFAAGVAVTILWCESMSEMGGMPMPGGWTMSMTWMRMPGEAWSDATTSFLGMWMVMMATMMLPSLVPMLWRYRRAIEGTRHLGRLTVLAGLGYFSVWSVIGMVVFPLGVALATLEMQEPALARVVPAATGVAVALLGALQFTAWKARRLASCREAPACCPLRAAAGAGAVTGAGAGAGAVTSPGAGVGAVTSAGAGAVAAATGPAASASAGAGAVTTAAPSAVTTAAPSAVTTAAPSAVTTAAPSAVTTAAPGAAWQHGLRLGLQCSACCANLMAIPLIIGVMDLRAMAIATAAITMERLAPAGQRVARAVGVCTVGAGLALVVGARTF